MHENTNLPKYYLRHSIQGDIAFIYLFAIFDKEQRNKGFGKQIFNNFISQLPKEINEIRLVAGNVEPDCDPVYFWKSLGFEFLYQLESECDNPEIEYMMTKPLNGLKHKKLIYRDIEE